MEMSDIFFKRLVEHPLTQRSIVKIIKSDRNKDTFETGGDVSLRKVGRDLWLYFKEVSSADRYLLPCIDLLERGQYIEEDIIRFESYIAERGKQVSGLSWDIVEEALRKAKHGSFEERYIAAREFRWVLRHFYLRDADVPLVPNYFANMHVHWNGCKKASDGDIGHAKKTGLPEIIICHTARLEEWRVEAQHDPRGSYAIVVVNPTSIGTVLHNFGDYSTGETAEELAEENILVIPTSDEIMTTLSNRQLKVISSL